MYKAGKIFLNFIPILIMIATIPLIKNDYFLTIFFAVIIVVSLTIKYTKNDFTLLILGFLFMTISESLFISTGVETFIRNSLFGLMPLWLPFLWGYGFVAIKRLVQIIEY
jgi:hypothetical protein